MLLLLLRLLREGGREEGRGAAMAVRLTDSEGKAEEEQNREPEGRRGGNIFVCQTGRFSRYIFALPLKIYIHVGWNTRSVIFLSLTVTDAGRLR